MKPAVLIGACVAGVVGALVWGAIAHFTGYEIGYIAWGIGLAVGYAALKFGDGEGSASTGVTCAIIAAASILAGKYAAYSLGASGAADEFLRGAYTEHRRDAAAFAKIDKRDDAAVKRFMVEREWTDEKTATKVTDAELAEFRETEVPYLLQLEQGMEFEAWKDSERAQFMSSMLSAAVASKAPFESTFGVVDIIFMVLGIATAFKVGSSG